MQRHFSTLVPSKGDMRAMKLGALAQSGLVCSKTKRIRKAERTQTAQQWSQSCAGTAEGLRSVKGGAMIEEICRWREHIGSVTFMYVPAHRGASTSAYSDAVAKAYLDEEMGEEQSADLSKAMVAERQGREFGYVAGGGGGWTAPWHDAIFGMTVEAMGVAAKALAAADDELAGGQRSDDDASDESDDDGDAKHHLISGGQGDLQLPPEASLLVASNRYGALIAGTSIAGTFIVSQARKHGARRSHQAGRGRRMDEFGENDILSAAVIRLVARAFDLAPFLVVCVCATILRQGQRVVGPCDVCEGSLLAAHRNPRRRCPLLIAVNAHTGASVVVEERAALRLVDCQAQSIQLADTERHVRLEREKIRC